MQFVSWWLFKAPEGHAREFSKAWVDRIVHRVTWKQFMIKLSEEWQEYTLFVRIAVCDDGSLANWYSNFEATVLLNANVAFLSVPGVINGDSPAQSAAQIASYMSIIMSIGSILLGLLLVRQNRTAKKDQVIPAVSACPHFQFCMHLSHVGGVSEQTHKVPLRHRVSCIYLQPTLCTFNVEVSSHIADTIKLMVLCWQRGFVCRRGCNPRI